MINPYFQRFTMNDEIEPLAEPFYSAVSKQKPIRQRPQILIADNQPKKSIGAILGQNEEVMIWEHNKMIPIKKDDI